MTRDGAYLAAERAPSASRAWHAWKRLFRCWDLVCKDKTPGGVGRGGQKWEAGVAD